MTPRYLYESTCSIYLPSNVKLATSLLFSAPSLNTITFVLKMLRLICHRWQYISSLCIKRCNPILVSDISTRSSSKSKWFINVPPTVTPMLSPRYWRISWIYSLKSDGLMTPPWRTPYMLSNIFTDFHIQFNFQFFSISNNFIVSQYTFSTIHMYTKRLHQHIHKQFSESIQCYGSKWSWKSCWIYGLLVWYTKYHLSQQGCKGAGGATVTTHFVSNMQHTAL